MKVSKAELDLIVQMKDEASRVAAGIKGELSGLSKMARDVKSGMSDLGKSMGDALKQGAKMAAIGVGGAVAAIASMGAVALNAASQVDAAYDAIQVATGATGDELAGLQDDFTAVFTSVPTQAEAAAEAISVLNQRLGMTGEPLQALSGQLLELARMTGGDVTTAAEGYASTLANWGIANEDASATLDRLFRATQETGIGFDELNAELAQNGPALREMGLSLEEAAALLGTFDREGVDSQQVMASLSRAAIKYADAGVSLSNGLSDTIAQIQNATSDTEALSLASELFGGRAAVTMRDAIRAGRLELGDLTAALEGSEGAIMDASAATMDWQEKLQLLKNKATTALAPIGLKLMDVASILIDRAMPAFETLTQFVTDTVVPALDPIVNGLGDVWDAISLLTTGDVSGFADLLAQGLGKIGEALGLSSDEMQPFLDRLREITEAVGGFVQDQLIPFVQEHAEGLKAAIIAIGVALAGLGIASFIASINPVTVIIAAIIAAIGLLAMAWEEDWGGIRTWLTDFWENTGRPIFEAVVTWLGTNIPIAIQALSEFWTGTLQPALQAIWAFLSENVIPILKVLGEIYIALVVAYFRILAGLVTEVIVPALQKLWEWLQQAAATISDVLGPVLLWLKESLLDPLIGAFESISLKIEDVVGFFEKLRDGIQNVKLPDWLTPGSPTPFELGLAGINEQMARLAGTQMPQLAGEMGRLPSDAPVASSGRTNTATASSGAAAGTSVVLNINVPAGADAAEIGRQSELGVRRALAARGV